MTLNEDGPVIPVALAMSLVPQEGQCSAEKAQALIGGRYDDKSVREKATAISGRGPLRWILPGAMVTQDYSPQRLNLEVGDDGKVARAWCG